VEPTRSLDPSRELQTSQGEHEKHPGAIMRPGHGGIITFACTYLLLDVFLRLVLLERARWFQISSHTSILSPTSLADLTTMSITVDL
jgi:hypothetical protein